MPNFKQYHPGFFVKDSLEVMNMTAKEFSIRTGISERTLSALITGHGEITFDIARKLAAFFDNSIDFWTNLENNYKKYLYDQKKKEEEKKEWDLAKRIKSYLIKRNFISKEDNSENIVIKCRKLAGVNSLILLDKKDIFTSFKQQQSKTEPDYFVQNFWIALALNKAREKIDKKYDKHKLIDSLYEIRKLTTLDIKDFYPKLDSIFKACGVSFVLLPYLSKSNIYGATKWFTSNNVMLAISNRGTKADMFWFTLFHEIAHVLMEHKRQILFSLDDQEDIEADKKAAELLIPNKYWNEFIKAGIFNKDSIQNFAQRLNILPCIVLGRLHKERPDLVPYGKYDKDFSISYDIDSVIEL